MLSRIDRKTSGIKEVSLKPKSSSGGQKSFSYN
jgi:hypothetical protein